MLTYPVSSTAFLLLFRIDNLDRRQQKAICFRFLAISLEASLQMPTTASLASHLLSMLMCLETYLALYYARYRTHHHARRVSGSLGRL